MKQVYEVKLIPFIHKKYEFSVAHSMALRESEGHLTQYLVNLY